MKKYKKEGANLSKKVIFNHLNSVLTKKYPDKMSLGVGNFLAISKDIILEIEAIIILKNNGQLKFENLQEFLLTYGMDYFECDEDQLKLYVDNELEAIATHMVELLNSQLRATRRRCTTLCFK